MLDIKIQTSDGKPVAQGVAGILKRVLDEINRESGKEMGKQMRDDVRDHIENKYPGSEHWDPMKVQTLPSIGRIGLVDVAIPGASRAYHPIDIRPVTKQALTIPIHKAAYGQSAKDIPDLFLIKKKDGKAFLAQSMADGSLRFMFVLKDHVHQRRDSTLMPRDSTLAKGIKNRITALAQKALDHAMT